MVRINNNNISIQALGSDITIFALSKPEGNHNGWFLFCILFVMQAELPIIVLNFNALFKRINTKASNICINQGLFQVYSY